MMVSDAYLAKIKGSELFDADWYKKTYSIEVEQALHYLTVGYTEGCQPSLHFDGDEYWRRYPDVRMENFNPLLHYLVHGKSEGRRYVSVANPIKSKVVKTSIEANTVPKPLAKAEVKVAAAKPAALKGALNTQKNNETFVKGWLALIGDEAPRRAKLVIDGEVFLVDANIYRADLKKNNINSGKHAFEFVPPISMIDGRAHKVELIDEATSASIASANFTWRQERAFSDFQGFMCQSMLSPLISAPFREEDKRCFAFMENVTRSLCSRAEKSQKPLVSVVMPMHNRQTTVAWAIQSVLDQTYGNFELIIVDDGSSDESVSVVKGIDDTRIKLHILPECGGVSRARNIAVQQSIGEYIFYLDSDNTWRKEYLAAMVGAFDALPTADAVCSGQLLYRGDQPEPFAARFGSVNISLLKNRNYVDMNAFGHRREVFERLGGFDEALRRYVDWDLILRISEFGGLYSIPVLLSNYYYDKAPNAITNDPTHIAHINVVREKTSARAKKREKNKIDAPDVVRRKVAIIIPSYQALEDILECIDSITSQGISSWCEIIVVDNASEAPVVESLRKLQEAGQITLIENSFNYGFTYAVNQGIACAPAEADIVLLNNDAVVSAGALEHLQDFALSSNECGLAVPAQVLPGGTKTIGDHVPHADGNFECDVNISAHHKNILKVPLFFNGGPLEISFAPFFCVYIKRSVLDRTGLLDAEFGRHYRSDRLLCDYVRHILNMKIFHVPQSIIYHKLQRSTDGMRDSGEKTKEFTYIFKRNQWEPEVRDRLGYVDAPWDLF
ncbi:glycosyltransferase [Roseateles sp. BYS180W]|uniref:Glycosyltransferase n=1 Tax=Roseateles rivi TaxID=3299028 RepID=A0ABW7FYF5_9BURK